MLDAMLGHRFGDPERLRRALTHRSAGHRNNERLEFLGDALVNLFVAELIYDVHERADEGDMTRLRAALVNGPSLADLARTHRLGEHLVLGPGEMKSGGHRRDSILADALEAVIAAIYQDAGWAICRERVRGLFADRVRAAGVIAKDPKTRLQERAQALGLALPVYELLDVRGEEHAREFEVVCHVAEHALRVAGSGSSRRAAEQAAAEALLERWPERADARA